MWGLTDQKSRQDSGYRPQAGPRRSLEKIRGQQHEDGVLKQHDLGHQKESQHAWSVQAASGRSRPAIRRSSLQGWGLCPHAHGALLEAGSGSSEPL